MIAMGNLVIDMSNTLGRAGLVIIRNLMGQEFPLRGKWGGIFLMDGGCFWKGKIVDAIFELSD